MIHERRFNREDPDTIKTIRHRHPSAQCNPDMRVIYVGADQEEGAPPPLEYDDPGEAVVFAVDPAEVRGRSQVWRIDSGETVHLPPMRQVAWRRWYPIATAVLLLASLVIWAAWSPSEPDAVQVIRQVYAAGYATVQELPAKYIDMVPEAYRYTLTRADHEMDAATWEAREKGLFYLTSEIQILGIQDPGLILLYERISIDDRYSEKMRSAAGACSIGMLVACGLIEESIAADMETKSQHVF